jgi:hypothetical protein
MPEICKWKFFERFEYKKRKKKKNPCGREKGCGRGRETTIFFLLGLIYKNIAIHVCSGLITRAIKHCYSCLPLDEEILFTLHLRLYNLFIIKRACTDLEFLINHCAGKLYIQKQAHCWHYTTIIPVQFIFGYLGGGGGGG